MHPALLELLDELCRLKRITAETRQVTDKHGIHLTLFSVPQQSLEGGTVKGKAAEPNVLIDVSDLKVLFLCKRHQHFFLILDRAIEFGLFGGAYAHT